MGLYISKLVIQSKQRPLYFIRETNYNYEGKARDCPTIMKRVLLSFDIEEFDMPAEFYGKSIDHWMIN